MKFGSGDVTPPPQLHSVQLLRRRHFNRLFAAAYAVAILCLFYQHVRSLLHSPGTLSSSATLLLFGADVVLAYMWSTTQSYRMNPVRRQEFPENLGGVEFPCMDIFICTADPYREPPVDVVNTALSVMAYEYPAEKLSVYVSDDGGSELTMFAFMEAATFGRVWLPFCKENNIADRSPQVYFNSNFTLNDRIWEIKTIYESMKSKIESAVESGRVSDKNISNEQYRHILNQFRATNFTRQNHPSIIQVLLNSNKDKDDKGDIMPNLVYVSRQKSTSTPHHFKAGALNTLLRVSACMSNSPIVLTLDCDMYSNDPLTAQRAFCYLIGESIYGYVQFPQRYHGLNKADIYASEHKRLFRLNPTGMNGLNGPGYVGTGCFFRRRAFFGGPSSNIQPEIAEIGPNHSPPKPINCQENWARAHHVSRCIYEENTNWGSLMGFRYGSLVEDYYTGYRLLCEGWHSIFCDPSRVAFLGGVPITLYDALSQNKRWAVGLLEVGFSKYSPLTFGIRAMGFLMGQTYAHYAFWPIWSLPITVYVFLPSLALLQGISIFPKVQEGWFLLYTILFLGAYGQDFVEFMWMDGTAQRWWSDQRMWLIRGLSSYLFGCIEYVTKCLGMATGGFNVTSKVMDDELNKRYDQGIFEFAIASPMFVPLATTSILNLIALIRGVLHVMRHGGMESFLMQILICGFGVLNSLPFIEAMALRRDKGRMPTKITIISTLIVGALHGITYFIVNTYSS